MSVAASAELHAVLNGKDDRGQSIFAVLVKRSYRIRPGSPAIRTDDPRPFVQADEYYDHGDPDWASVEYETDYVPFKPVTDVVFVGTCFAPGGEPVPQVDVVVEVAGQTKRVRVYGDRQCVYRSGAAPAFSEPVPFTKMPVQYERAYGGKDLASDPDAPFYYPRNYIGAGVVLKNTEESVDGRPLPNIEDPEDLLTPDRVIIGEPERWSGQPLPDGLGWFHRAWYPRCVYTGVVPSYVDVDTVLREERLGLVPKGHIALSRQFKLPSFDVRFNSGASRGLAFPHLDGTETIQLTNLTPGGSLAFQLPGETPRIVLDIGLGENELEPVLQTVCVRLEEMEVDLVWRGAHPYPGLEWLPEMKKMAASVF